ncbi:MAG: hypothetical protein PHY47_11685 [Lachnospiraceae bacterium]|nr:hypothetical protein [Lachnospiraceae bacterium]
MKKRVLAILLGCLLLIIISNLCKWYAISIMLIIVLGLTIISALLCKYSNVSILWKKAPDLLNDGQRNFGIMYLGWPIEYVDGLDMTVVYSNLYSDFLIFQRYYSLLKKGGTVIFYLKDDLKYFYKRKLSLFCLNMLHPVTLLEHGKIYYDYEYKWNEMFNTIIYFLMIFRKEIRVTKINYNQLREIKTFAQERDLEIVFRFKGETIKNL